MTEVRAKLYNFRQSPRKVRLVTALIKGQSVKAALSRLQHQPQKSVVALIKLIRSAIASAINNYGLSEDSLRIGSVMVDAAVTYKRYKPAARGSANPIRRTGSTISLILISPDEPKRSAVKPSTSADETANRT